jgi:hypothetical protein
MSATPNGCSSGMPHGLRRGRCHPPGDRAAFRADLRRRERLLKNEPSRTRHRQHAPTRMNMQLHHGVSDSTGKTGKRIIRAILAGARDPGEPAGDRDGRCRRRSRPLLGRRGNDRPKHRFAPGQAVALHDADRERIAARDRRREAPHARPTSPAPPLGTRPASPIPSTSLFAPRCMPSSAPIRRSSTSAHAQPSCPLGRAPSTHRPAVPLARQQNLRR